MSTKKPANSFWLIFVSGMLTGMGNGSVFGAALMCLMGRGEYMSAYNPSTFTGFIDCAMIVFGLAFCVILYVGLNSHSRLEQKAA